MKNFKLNNLENPKNPKKEIIVDYFKKDIWQLYCLYTIFMYFFGIVSFLFITTLINDPSGSNTGIMLFGLFFICAIIALLTTLIWLISRNFSYERKCIISDDGIFFSTPLKSDFFIKWSEFTLIELSSYYPGGWGSSTNFEFHFLGESCSRQFIFTTNIDFHAKDIIPQILFTIKWFADKFDKEIIATNIDSKFGSKMMKILEFT